MNFIKNPRVHTYGEIKIKNVNNKFFILNANPVIHDLKLQLAEKLRIVP